MTLKFLSLQRSKCSETFFSRYLPHDDGLITGKDICKPLDQWK